MALITPPELLETQPYPFQRLRYMNEHLGLQEGVWGANDYRVVQRAAGADMSVDVGAGAAWIKGDTGTRQGLYHLVNDATVNLALGAAHATLPRIDQVIARIADSTVSGVSDIPMLELLAGTATSGATLDNRKGAAALPNDAIRLADILVPATDTSISTSQIWDRRPWAQGGFVVANPPDFSSALSANTYFNIASAIRLECSGVPLRIAYESMLSGSVTNTQLAAQVLIDGVAWTTFDRHYTRIADNALNYAHHIERVVVPTVGSHVFQLQGKTLLAATAGFNDQMLALQELPSRQNAVNG